MERKRNVENWWRQNVEGDDTWLSCTMDAIDECHYSCEKKNLLFFLRLYRHYDEKLPPFSLSFSNILIFEVCRLLLLFQIHSTFVLRLKYRFRRAAFTSIFSSFFSDNIFSDKNQLMITSTCLFFLLLAKNFFFIRLSTTCRFRCAKLVNNVQKENRKKIYSKNNGCCVL